MPRPARARRAATFAIRTRGRPAHAAPGWRSGRASSNRTPPPRSRRPAAGNPVSKCPTDCRVDFGLDGNGLNGNPGVEALIANMVPQIWKAQTDPWLDAWGVNPTAGTGNSNLESADRVGRRIQ